MATYFLTGTYSPEAVKGISRKRTSEATKLIESLGGKLISIYLLLGEKDVVIIADFPGIKEALKASVELSRDTAISFKTSPALTAAEFDEFLAGS